MASLPTETRPQGATSELRLRVTGMHCAGCAASVQSAIESEPGVSEASVSVIEGMATVNGTGLDSAGLIRAVEAKGFGVQPVEDSVAPAQLRSEIELKQTISERKWRYRAIIGLGIWIPLEALHWLAPLTHKCCAQTGVTICQPLKSLVQFWNIDLVANTNRVK